MRLKWVRMKRGMGREKSAVFTWPFLHASPQAFSPLSWRTSTHTRPPVIAVHIQQRQLMGEKKKKRTANTKLNLQIEFFSRIKKSFPGAREGNRDWFWLVLSSCSFTVNRDTHTRICTHKCTRLHYQSISAPALVFVWTTSSPSLCLPAHPLIAERSILKLLTPSHSSSVDSCAWVFHPSWCDIIWAHHLILIHCSCPLFSSHPASLDHSRPIQ